MKMEFLTQTALVGQRLAKRRKQKLMCAILLRVILVSTFIFLVTLVW